MVSTDSFERSASLGDSPVKESFTPIPRTESGHQELETAIRHPATTLEIVGSEILYGRASGDNLSLPARDFKPNLEEEALESVEEQLNCWGLAGDRPVV